MDRTKHVVRTERISGSRNVAGIFIMSTGMKNKLWKDWTPEDFQKAEYCKVCGLPLIEVENAEDSEDSCGVRRTENVCVWCTWNEDSEKILSCGHEDVKLLQLGEMSLYICKDCLRQIFEQYLIGVSTRMVEQTVYGIMQSENFKSQVMNTTKDILKKGIRIK